MFLVYLLSLTRRRFSGPIPTAPG